MGISASLYLVPVGMSDAPLSDVIPAGNIEIIKRIRYFIVENIRSARRFLKRCAPETDISQLTFYELNRHTDISTVSSFLDPLRHGEEMAVMSDAGCPAIADPGALPVAIAQEEGFTVRPLVGPSSILMGIMASGFNGQGFCFHGYLPIDDNAKAEMLRKLEIESRRLAMTQIFIETPYRNLRLLKFLADHLSEQTAICVACNLTDPEKEWVKTLPAGKWRRLIAEHPEKVAIDKRPSIFLMYAGGKEDVQQSKKNHYSNKFKK